MSTPHEDFQLLSNQLESWVRIVPEKAVGFHHRRLALVQDIRGITGSFQRDPAATAAVHKQFQELEHLLPPLQDLLSLHERARVLITELRASAPGKGAVQTAVQEISEGWLGLMDFLIQKTSDPRAAERAIFQVKRITSWAEERKQALAILSKAGALRNAVKDLGHKNEITKALGEWSKAFCDSNAPGDWKTAAEPTLKRFEGFRQEEARAETLKEVAQNEESAAKSKTAPPEEKTAEQAQMHFFRIEQALAECRDLTEALEYRGLEINEFTSRQWKLRNSPDSPLDEIRKLEDDIEACRKSFLQRAESDADRMLRQLQLRWSWYRSVYDARPDIEQMVRDAEAVKPNAADRFRELFTLILQAEQRIYALVDGNRPKLAAYVRQAADARLAEIEELRQQSRLASLDAALAGLEARIPEDPGSQVPARQSFERLEKCHALESEIKKWREENEARQAEVLETAERLTALASDIAAMSDGSEVTVLAARIPRELSPDRRLDDIVVDLIEVERLLNVRRAELLTQKTSQLLSQRKENLAWIRALRDLAPEVESLAAKGAAPQDLEEICLALEIEQRHRNRIAELAVTAANRLNERRAETTRRLQTHIDTPAFETHPERETAEHLLRELMALPNLDSAPTREGFSKTYEGIANAEGFVDRIESARRSYPERLKKLEARLEILREWNGIAYRPDLARRTNMMVEGIQMAIQREQWEPLNFQIARADALLSALERDALAQISAETEELVESLRNALNRNTDQVYARQVEAALNELEEWQLEPPPYALRRRLSQMAGGTFTSSRGPGA